MAGVAQTHVTGPYTNESAVQIVAFSARCQLVYLICLSHLAWETVNMLKAHSVLAPCSPST